MATTLYKVGALGTDDLTQVLQFQALFNAGVDRVSHLRLPFDTAGYQVPVGKTLYIVKIIDSAVGVSNAAYYKMGYCDNDVGFDTITARTNPVMAIGVDDAANNGMGIQATDSNAGNSARNAESSSNLIAVAVSGKFPFMRRVSVAAGASVLVWGILL